jgi:hypothetical protein
VAYGRGGDAEKEGEAGAVLQIPKFQGSLCKLNFSPLSCPQMKSFEYQNCSGFQDLQLWFQALLHLRFSL